MSDHNLEEIIGRLQQISVVNAPYVGVHHSDPREESFFIAANREGLILLSTQLLQLALESGKGVVDEHHELSGRLEWINRYSDIALDHIVVKEPEQEEVIAIKSSLKDKLGNVGCVLVILLILTILAAGIYLLGNVAWQIIGSVI